MKDILIILPSRGRPQNVLEAHQSWEQTTSGRSTFLVCLDKDDIKLEEYARNFPVNVSHRVGERLRVGPTLNQVVSEYPDYLYYAFLGDDHRFRTKDWETIAIQKIEENGGWGVIYGRDLFQNENLPTAVIISANIVHTLGYFALPGLTHLYLDNTWLELGRGINKLFYLPEIIIEHLHFAAGKSTKDAGYAEVNSPEMYSHDGNIFSEWQKNQKEKDIAKLLHAMR